MHVSGPFHLEMCSMTSMYFNLSSRKETTQNLKDFMEKYKILKIKNKLINRNIKNIYLIWYENCNMIK